MRVKQVSSYLGVATSTIWSWCKAGNFPTPLKLSPKATVWDKDEIDKFIASKRA
jgi:predicted DNA-binding transcriptional regulator AlpA